MACAAVVVASVAASRSWFGLIAPHSTPFVVEGNPATFPFAPPPGLRKPDGHDALPSLYADSAECSAGCRPRGAIEGWPLEPFHSQHALRAGLDELRPAGFHVGVDIQAVDNAKVYAIQPGQARVIPGAGGDSRVQVGNFTYWHVRPTVASGTYVRAYSDSVGTVLPHFGHIALSEEGGRHPKYLNPLRPGGRVLSPWRDDAAPVIGLPQVRPDGRVTVGAFDPQSMQEQTTYVTPVLTPAAVAYRLSDASGHQITDLKWALRATQYLPPNFVPRVFAPGADAPGFACFDTRSLCIPNWTYNLAGGLAERLPAGLPPGHYRLTIYAWDWADNKSALDTDLDNTSTGWSVSAPQPAHALAPRR